MDEIIEIPPTPKRFFKGTAAEYADLNKAISERFHYPKYGTENYYSDSPAIDIHGNCVMEVDGFIIDMMPEVFADIILHDTVEYPIDETEL